MAPAPITMDHYPERAARAHTLPAERCVALVDARYLRWLAAMDEADDNSPAPLNRERLNELLRQTLHKSGVQAALLRTYWYTDSDDQQVVDDQTVRMLPLHDTDGSALVRQLSADLQALVASRRVDAVLIASDDDRLVSVMDATKLAGVSLCLLVDERAQDMGRLATQDPNWARMLRDGDRRVVVRSADLGHALEGMGGGGTATRDNDATESELQEVVQGWWQALDQDEQQAVREELPALRGLPPEIDRELLLRAKNKVRRGLNFNEKRILRSCARQVGLGIEPSAEADFGSSEATSKS